MPATRPDHTRPFRLLNSRSLSPIVLTCEHASRALPRGMRPSGAAERAVLGSHWGWDIGAWNLTRGIARRLGAGAVGGRWSRLVVDLNRPLGDPTLVRPAAEGVTLSWNARLGPAEIERRMLSWHVPYHAAVDRMVIRRLARGVRPLLFAVHTFTPIYEGRVRDFDAGVLFDRSRPAAIALARGLRRAGLRVRYNRPYSGLAGMMYSIHRHASHHGLPCLELEINQGLLTGPRRDGGVAAERIAAAIASALRPVMAMAAAVPTPAAAGTRPRGPLLRRGGGRVPRRTRAATSRHRR
jgi:predicted N-formylglutamate amidohydrolase